MNEKVLNKIISQSYKKLIKENLLDYDENSGIFDMKSGGIFKVRWIFRRKIGYGKWEDVSEGMEDFHSKKEAKNFVSELVDNYSDWGVFAVQLRIEELIKTLSDDRWETVKDWSHMMVCDIKDKAASQEHPNESKKRFRRMVRENVAKTVKGILNEDYGQNFDTDPNDEEDMPCWDVFTEDMSLSQIKELLLADLFDKQNRRVGKLRDFHFKYIPSTDRLVGIDSW